MIRARLQIGILAVMTAVATPGCALWPHNLKPHRLWRLNQMPARTGNAYFSVADEPPLAVDRDGTAEGLPADEPMSR